MKNVVLSMFVALAFSVSAFAEVTGTANPEKSAVSLRKLEDKKVQLLFGQVPDGAVTVKIFDENHVLVQKDRIFAKEAFAKYYDFSKLAPAKYTVEVSNGKEIVEQAEFEIKSEVKTPVVYSKVDRVEANKYKLLVNALLASDLSVTIYENDKLVHVENISNSKGFEKIYVFNQKIPGSRVEFFVSSSDGFSKLLAVK